MEDDHIVVPRTFAEEWAEFSARVFFCDRCGCQESFGGNNLAGQPCHCDSAALLRPIQEVDVFEPGSYPHPCRRKKNRTGA